VVVRHVLAITHKEVHLVKEVGGQASGEHLISVAAVTANPPASRLLHDSDKTLVLASIYYCINSLSNGELIAREEREKKTATMTMTKHMF
jgi:hypothetical protein